jgi:hypothetical protein
VTGRAATQRAAGDGTAIYARALNDKDTKDFLEAIELAKARLGRWDEYDPVAWALPRVVTAKRLVPRD